MIPKVLLIKVHIWGLQRSYLEEQMEVMPWRAFVYFQLVQQVQVVLNLEHNI